MPIDPDQLRSLVQDCIAKHLYSTAVFYADKLVTVTNNAPGDVYLLAQTYYVSRQHRRGIMLLKTHGLLEDVRFRYLAAKCLAAVEEWDECLTLIGDGGLVEDVQEEPQHHGWDVSTHAAVWLLRGKAFESLDNRQRAITCYTTALRVDPFCQEAFAALVDNHMLTNDEELALLDSLPFSAEDRWITLLYKARCKKYLQLDTLEQHLQELQQQPCQQHTDMMVSASNIMHDVNEKQAQQQQLAGGPRSSQQQQGAAQDQVSASLVGHGLEGNPEVLACHADWLFHLGRYEAAYQLTSGILSSDPYATQALVIHLAAALQLGKKNELFLRGHKLVEEHPDSALAWYGVGCYYMASKQFEQARRFFAKATQLDKHNAYAWIAFGHAFAEQDESDQALAAYRTAARLFPGLHTPLLGMGSAYQRMNNPHLCERCFLQAYNICPHDPSSAHELGVLAYRNHQYEAAASWLSRALQLVPGGQVTPAWEVTVINLAHVMRKLQQHQQALQLYQQALRLNRTNPGSYAGLAYTYQLMGNSAAAVEHYHKALSLRPDDAFASEMLGLALQEDCALFGRDLDACGKPEF